MDYNGGVSADGLGNVYISGDTTGGLGGDNAGAYDAFVSKYDAAGNLLWTEQLGTAMSDHGNGVIAPTVWATSTSRGTPGQPGRRQLWSG